MNAKEIWEETVRQMRESPEFQDAGVMYAQGEIERLKEENEMLIRQLSDSSLAMTFHFAPPNATDKGR